MKSTGVGGRGGARLRPRQEGPGPQAAPLLVDTEGLVMRAKVVHSAGVFDRGGIKPLMGPATARFPRLSHLWLGAGYNGKGKGVRTGPRRPWA